MSSLVALGGIEALATVQGGLLHRRQILAAGRTDEWIEAQLHGRRWQRVFPGVYATFTGPLPWLSQAWAALLYAGDDAVLGGRSALFAAGYRHDTPPLPIRICVPHGRHLYVPEQVELKYRRHLQRLRHPAASLPRLRCEVAVLETASEQPGLGSAIGIIADACQQRLTSPPLLRDALWLKPRLRWRHSLAAVIDDVATGAYSYLEVRYLRDVERPHGLPRGNRQGTVQTGRSRCYRDVEYVPYGVVSELDGRLSHELAIDRSTDMDRDNAAPGTSKVTYRFGYRQVTDSPCGTAAIVAAGLRSRGWRGEPRPCGPTCRLWCRPSG